MRGVGRNFDRLPIRHKLLAIAAAATALAVLVIAAALALDSHLYTSFWHTLVAIAVALAAGIGLAGILFRRVTRPLETLSAALGELSRRRDYALRMPPGGDEIGRLSNSINLLLGEIERARATLDEQVMDRSAALSAANAQLREAAAQSEAARQRADAASQAKSAFIANMSHELRTPLNAIIGFSDLMKSQTLGPIGNRTYLEYAADINFSGAHLLDIINDILDVVRYEAGRMELKEEPVAIEEIVHEALRLIAPQAAQGEVRVGWTPPPAPLPPLYCDPLRLRQMLLNILSNAVKFTRPGGTVDIVAELGDDLQLVVRDTGIGIRPEDLARIMTPFGQIASAYSRERQGAGLGLTLTKALIERHGGRLSLESTPGIGTVVRLVFPAVRIVR